MFQNEADFELAGSIQRPPQSAQKNPPEDFQSYRRDIWPAASTTFDSNEVDSNTSSDSGRFPSAHLYSANLERFVIPYS